MILILSCLLNKLDLALETPDYTVKVHATPLPNPCRRFRIRVRAKR